MFFTVWFAAEELEAADLLEGTDVEGHPYGENLEPDAHRLTQMATQFQGPVTGFSKHWGQPGSRLWLAAQIGDWPLARELAASSGREDLLAAIAPRAETCRQQRLETVRRDRDQDPDLRQLLVLGEMEAQELDARIRRGLRVMPNAYWVLDFVDKRDDPKWCPEILRLFRRVRLGGPMEWPEVAGQCGGFLARHSFPAAGVIESVARSQKAMDEAAMFLLQHAPESALPVVRRGLRDTAPPARQPDLFGAAAAQLSSQSARMAVVLAIIDRPWSRRELSSALDELQDQGAGLMETAAVALALAESCDPEARQVAATWRSRYGRGRLSGSAAGVGGCV